MAFIDELQFHAKAGHGGHGVVRWRQEKFIDKGGPSGGDGGWGGNIFVRAIRDLHTLARYRHKKEFSAERGGDGEKKSRHGKNGDDLYIELPIGSVITNTETGARIVLEKDGQEDLLLKGGKGGWGNEHYKSSVNTTPKEQSDGVPGEEGTFAIELELFADIGLVGEPNAGKSSLLNALTNATSKVGDYAFTTLDPNLGDLFGYVIADIPGLIEGASEGKGLGTKFLRHIKRTKMIVHLVSFDNLTDKEKGGTRPVRGREGSQRVSASDGMMKVYKEIRKELKTYGNGLDEKEEIILLTKTDVIPESKEGAKLVAKKIKDFEKLGNPVFTISLYDDKSVKKFRDALVKILKQKEK